MVSFKVIHLDLFELEDDFFKFGEARIREIRNEKSVGVPGVFGSFDMSIYFQFFNKKYTILVTHSVERDR